MAKKKPKSLVSEATEPLERVHVKQVAMAWDYPEKPQFTFANHMMIQADEESCYLSFFVATPPLLMGSREEVTEKIEKLTQVTAHCVGQMIVPRDKLPAFAAVIQATIKQLADKTPPVDPELNGTH